MGVALGYHISRLRRHESHESIFFRTLNWCQTLAPFQRADGSSSIAFRWSSTTGYCLSRLRRDEIDDDKEGVVRAKP